MGMGQPVIRIDGIKRDDLQVLCRRISLDGLIDIVHISGARRLVGLAFIFHIKLVGRKFIVDLIGSFHRLNTSRRKQLQLVDDVRRRVGGIEQKGGAGSGLFPSLLNLLGLIGRRYGVIQNRPIMANAQIVEQFGCVVVPSAILIGVPLIPTKSTKSSARNAG